LRQKLVAIGESRNIGLSVSMVQAVGLPSSFVQLCNWDGSMGVVWRDDLYVGWRKEWRHVDAG